MRVLALDYGSARCGCAVSDPTGTIVTPLEAVRATGDPARAERACASWSASARSSASSSACRCRWRARDTEQTRETRAFAERALAAPRRRGCRSSCTTSASPRAWPSAWRAPFARARIRAPRPTCSRAGSRRNRVSLHVRVSRQSTRPGARTHPRGTRARSPGARTTPGAARRRRAVSAAPARARAREP